MGNAITEPKVEETPYYLIPNEDPRPEALQADPNTNANMYGIGTNYAASNSWFAYLPLENILGKKYNNLDLHIKSFSIPQMLMTTTQMSYRGYTKEVPTKVINPDTKELTIEYIVDENWQNYRSLYAWMTCVEGSLNPVTTDEANQGIQPDDYIPLRIYLLNNYKKKIIQFRFDNCWIKVFNELQLQADNPGEVVGSFTFAYDSFTIEDL